MKSRALPQFRMLLRFTGLVLAWSILVSLVIGTDTGYNHVVNFARIGALFGAFLGLIAVVVALIIGEVRDHGQFKLTLALFTSLLPGFLVIFLLHLASAFGISASEFIYLLVILSILPCVIWFSQIVARQYLREISPRKRKQKPTQYGALPAAADSVDGG